MQRVIPSLRASLRAYSTTPPPPAAKAASSNLAPILLGLGLVGAGGFYYSTLDQKKALKTPKAVPTTAALKPDEFVTLKLEKVVPFNHNTSTFTFALPPNTHSGLSVASALVVKSVTPGEVVDKKGNDVVRPYTPVTAPDNLGSLELLIKHYKGGLMTEHIFGLKPGQELAVKGPIPKWKYEPNQFEHIGLLAGGSGITPMWQIMQHIAANPSDKTKATLVFSNVTEADILLRSEFESLASTRPDQFKVVFVLDHPGDTWKGEKGYITKEVLAKALPPPSEGEKIKIFVCGPPPQVEAISGKKASMKDQGELKGVLAEMGYQASQVFKF